MTRPGERVKTWYWSTFWTGWLLSFVFFQFLPDGLLSFWRMF